ncbi:protein cordon-bleu [Talpa occidentalis]|uniref:protein cordon-bleu n=1 Tax=Talpa occidentalis TaxID=50954 RepID=UPI0023F70993|nr:protein cordon-bleu [Talpa occidentalis]
MKARAPPPPGKPASPNVHSEQKLPRDVSPGPQQNLLTMKEQLQKSMVDITVVLPSGMEKKSTVNGSHAMMDLLVELCLQNHLNPSHHTLEIWSSETEKPLSFKPNTLVGMLDVHTAFLKEKVPEEKMKTSLPKVPEKSVLLIVNYLRTQKAVMRVSPNVPLQSILPAICAKCEVSTEHVILLRDNVTWEELELSKSLNDLGIKELYAWDNKRETFRKPSLCNDEAEKEKKKILGFFKVNKRSNSKVEQLGLSGVDSDEDTSKSALGESLNGYITTPNSPSLKSRSITLGTSLSLSNISGVSMKSDMKKRRAPLPPLLSSAGTPVQDRASEKMSLGSQIDLQKKKRRAPAPPLPQPPPPSPLVPNRTADSLEKRKSAMGIGRQVPQKPPRGTARGPPHLVLPPPPPYPPPDTDVAEPLSFPGEGAGAEATDLRPTLTLPLDAGGICSTDGVPPVLSEAEETVSVGSCFASEDTTEDSGVMSSPSDIISLDSQHDTMKSKDKWATDQEDYSDQDLAATPELGPQKSPSWERNGSRNWNPRTEKAVRASDGDEDLFINVQFQKALAELDEDLEEMEESYETDTSSLASNINGVSSRCTLEAIIPKNDVDAIPVTFIGEVLDDPMDSGLLSNKNNNAGCFDLGSVTRGAPKLSYQTERSQQPERKRVEVSPSAPSHHMGKEIKLSLPNTHKDVNLIKMEPGVTSASKQNTKEQSQDPGSAHRGKTQAVEIASSQPVREEGDNNNNVSASSWHRGQNPGGSYGLKYGLTTYKIVPPKPEMKCYDRGVSLSTGAIKIDELGNLVSPHTSGCKTFAMTSPALEAETQSIGKIKEFWRSNSVEKNCQLTECSAKRTPTCTPTTPEKSQQSRLRAEPTSPEPKVMVPQQQLTHHENGKHLEERSHQPHMAATCHMKVPAANVTEVPFLKPQRRTSSQYVASAISKRIGPPKASASVVRKYDNAGKPIEGREPALKGQPEAVKDGVTTSPSLQLHKHSAESPCGHLPNTNREELAVGILPRKEACSFYRKLSTQESPADTQRRAYVPSVTSSQRGHVSMGQSCDFSGKQNTSNPKTSSASYPKYMLDSTNPPASHSGDDQNPGKAQVNGTRWVPIHSESPKSPSVSSTNGHAGREPLEQDDKQDTSCENDGTLPSSIFGPKKKFKPVVQRPAPKDTSLHSALMEAIHSAGGKDKLRKTAEHTSGRGSKEPSYPESESERSALLAAIRGHRGASSLRKVSSSASEELRSFRDASLSSQGAESLGLEDLGVQPHPPLPPPPPPATGVPSLSRTAFSASAGPPSDLTDARQALMDAIRSGTGAARLRKVPLLV